MGKKDFFFGIFLKCSQINVLFEFFRKIFLVQYIESYRCFCAKILVEKQIKNHFFEDFETKKLLEKLSEKMFLIGPKIHQKKQKLFQNIFT